MYRKRYNLLIILILLLSLVGCIEGEKDPKDHIIVNEDVSVFVITRGTTKYIYNYLDEKEETTTFNMFLNVYSPNDEVREIEYQFKAINTFYERLSYKSTSKQTLPFEEQLIYENNVSGNGFSEFFIKINTIDDEYNFYEKAMEISPYDFSGYKDELVSELIDINYIVFEDSEKYNVEFIIDTNDNIHLDMQTFLVSEDRKIYSFLGLYGYNSNTLPYNIENNYIYKEMKMIYLYISLNIYKTDEEKTEIRARIPINELLRKV